MQGCFRRVSRCCHVVQDDGTVHLSVGDLRGRPSLESVGIEPARMGGKDPLVVILILWFLSSRSESIPGAAGRVYRLRLSEAQSLHMHATTRLLPRLPCSHSHCDCCSTRDAAAHGSPTTNMYKACSPSDLEQSPLRVLNRP